MSSYVDLILEENVPKLGQAGELVKVRAGYARNYLLPNGLGNIVTRASLAALEERKAELEAKAKAKREKAEEVKNRIDGSSVSVEVKSGASGKLFGAITKADIAYAIKEKLSVEIRKEDINLPNPIKAIGEFEISFTLVEEIKANIVLKVVASES